MKRAARPVSRSKQQRRDESYTFACFPKVEYCCQKRQPETANTGGHLATPGVRKQGKNMATVGTGAADLINGLVHPKIKISG